MNDTAQKTDRQSDNLPGSERTIPAASPLPKSPAEASLASRPFSRPALYALAADGKLDAPTLEGALRLLGVRPDAPAWLRYCFHLLCVCGALFLASSVVCFIAWNWPGLSHFTKFGILEALVGGCVLLAFWRGPASTAGSAALTAAGLCLGPLLAVFGQTYMSGAFMWELYRAWACMLLPLALAGGSSGLWLLTWLVASAWGLGYMESLSQSDFVSYGFPEFFLLQAIALCILEFCMYRARHGGGQRWLRGTWLPRLMVFAIYALTTFVLSIALLDHHYSDLAQSRKLLLPFMPSTAVLYGLSLPVLYYWYRHKRPDLFMLACGLFSLSTLPVVLLLADWNFDIGGLLFLGILVIILTVLCSKALLNLQRAMEADKGTSPGHTAPQSNIPAPQGDAAREQTPPHPFSFERPLASWACFQDLLLENGLWPKDKAFPQPPPAGAPWYINTMLGFGGWLAALLFVAFLAILLLDKLRIGGTSIDHVFLITGIVLLAGGGLCSRLPGIFARQYGLAGAIAGGVLASSALVLTGNNHFWPAPCLLLCAAGFLGVRNKTFRFLAAGACVVFTYYLLDILVWNSPGYSLFHSGRNLDEQAVIAAIARSPLMALFWLALFALQAIGWHRQSRWLTSESHTQIMEPLLLGVYTSLLLGTAIGTGFPVLLGQVPFLLIPRSGLGLAAASGCLLLVYLLGARPLPSLPAGQAPGTNFGLYRFSLMACLLIFPLGWYLPGAAIALFGFLLSRHIGSAVLFGGSSLFLAVYVIQYYYNLNTSLLEKSYSLAAFGSLLLAVAALLLLYTKRVKGLSIAGKSGGIPRTGLRAVALVCSLALCFGLFHWTATQKELLLDGGTHMYLRLAPVDPRAFLLGDYMALRYALEGELAGAVRQREQDEAGEAGKLLSDGLAVVQRSDRGLATFVRLDDDTPLAEDEHLLYYRMKKGQPEIAAHAYFFQEGQAKDYEQAVYGEIHVDTNGKNLLTHLLDGTMRRIQPEK